MVSLVDLNLSGRRPLVDLCCDESTSLEVERVRKIFWIEWTASGDGVEIESVSLIGVPGGTESDMTEDEEAIKEIS